MAANLVLGLLRVSLNWEKEEDEEEMTGSGMRNLTVKTLEMWMALGSG